MSQHFLSYFLHISHVNQKGENFNNICNSLVPLNSGLMLNTEIHPALANCPSNVSKYTSGMPHVIKVNKYGMRNAPVEKRK